MTAGDFSRFSFDPLNNVRTVMYWQGRPLTDADLNEGNEAILRRVETEAVDVIGADGAPLKGGGFRLLKDVTQLTPAEAADLRNQSDASLTNLQNARFLITAGRYYIHGLQVENHRICGPLPLTSSDPAPRFPSQPLPLPANALDGNGTRLVYLRAVIDHQTGVEAPRLLESALGDADTSSRAVVAWQVSVMEAPDGAGCDSAETVTAWNEMTAPSSGRLQVSLNAAAPSADPCRLTLGGGYVRPENQLYRVQVHDGVPIRSFADGPRFQRDGLKLKISRNNAMEVARISKVTANNLKVAPGSRDGLPTFRQGDWIEILKDGAEARGDAAAGWTQVLDVAGDVLTVASSAGAADNDRVRLWSFDLMTAPGNTADSLPIEDGLEIRIPAGGEFRRDEYWLIAARYAVGPEYWNALTAKAMPPLGPRIEYARIAMLVLNAGAVQTVSDCRPTFEALNELLSFHYAGGDGQTVNPAGVAPGGLVAAPSQVRAGVRLGRKPAKGARVRFEVFGAGAAQIRRSATDPAPGPMQGNSVIVTTGADGIAAVDWLLDLAEPVQRVHASLLDANDTSNIAMLPLPIEYSASLNRAAHVAYTAGGCAGLNGINDVQAALDKLCVDLASMTAPPRPEFLIVESVVLLDGRRSPLENNTSIKPEQLSRGIEVRFNKTIGMRLSDRGNEPILRVWLDLPFPSDKAARQSWRDYLDLDQYWPIGTVPLSLTGRIRINREQNGLEWIPDKIAMRLLQMADHHRFGLQLLDEQAIEFEDLPIKAFLSIRGDCVWSKNDDPRQYLNGEVLAFNSDINRFSMDPKQFDLQRAADYRIWFYFELKR
jgi:hypothetical protein